jgi:hypothetical protein
VSHSVARARIPIWRSSRGIALRVAGTLLALAASVTFVACSHSESRSGTPSQTLVTELHKIADEAARDNGGRVVHAQAVRSTNAKAWRLFSGSKLSGEEAVWAIQVEGDFVCSSCRGQRSAAGPRGHVLQITVHAVTLQTNGFGIQDRVADLSRLGPVIVLEP